MPDAAAEAQRALIRFPTPEFEELSLDGSTPEESEEKEEASDEENGSSSKDSTLGEPLKLAYSLRPPRQTVRFAESRTDQPYSRTGRRSGGHGASGGVTRTNHARRIQSFRQNADPAVGPSAEILAQASANQYRANNNSTN